MPPQTKRRQAANATAVAVPLGVDLRCIDGLRVVASVGIVLLHCFMYWQVFLSYHVKYELTRHNLLVKLVSGGMAWVDLLLVLSAMLATFKLMPQLEDRSAAAPSCGQVVVAYWWRRALRILPAYLAANLAAALALGPADASKEAVMARWIHFYHCPHNIWANLLFVQNFLGTQACAIHLWTVAVQLQFYLAFPLLAWALRPRSPGFCPRLAATLAALFLAGTAWRLWAVWQAEDMQLPVSDFAVDTTAQQSWARMLRASYLPTQARLAELATGAALGLLLRWPQALKQLQSRKSLVAAVALAAQAAHLYLLSHRHLLFRAPGSPPWPSAPLRLHLALLSWGSPYAALLAAACLLALVLRAGPVYAACADALSAPLWRPLARLSYAQYLSHEQARLWVILLLPAGLLPRFIMQQPHGSLAVLCVGTLAAGYACALPLYWFVERPWLSRKAQM